MRVRMSCCAALPCPPAVGSVISAHCVWSIDCVVMPSKLVEEAAPERLNESIDPPLQAHCLLCLCVLP